MREGTVLNELMTKALGSGWFDGIILVLGAVIGTLIGSWVPLMTAFLILQSVDIVSGVMASGKEKNDISSSRFYGGLKKKGGMWLLIIVANQIDQFAFGTAPVVKTVVVSYLIANEGLSILENLGTMGVKIPKSVSKFLEKLRDENENGDLKG